MRLRARIGHPDELHVGEGGEHGGVPLRDAAGAHEPDPGGMHGAAM
jgi:hypothetical protein